MRLPVRTVASVLLLLTGCTAPPPSADASHDPADPNAVGPTPAAVPATRPISVVTTSATGPSTAAAAYVCPMHAEVTSDRPGRCPECGMALARKEVTP